MKKIISFIGIASIMCLFPCCKKSDNIPDIPGARPAQPSVQAQTQALEASLSVVLDSKPCTKPQDEYTSMKIDIKGISVYNAQYGWEDLTIVPGAVDVVSLQNASVPNAALTENSSVHAGTISKIKLIIGDNNRLVVNNQPNRCFNVRPKEVIIDIETQLKAGVLNQIAISMDLCGSIFVQQLYNEDLCYTLNPVMNFESLMKVDVDVTETPNGDK